MFPSIFNMVLDLTSITPTMPTPNRCPVPSRLLVKLKDLSNFEKVGEGSQGVVYRAKWQGNTVIYKQMKLVYSGDDREEFMREFNVWQYVPSSLSLLTLFWFWFHFQACCTPVVCIALWDCWWRKRIWICGWVLCTWKSVSKLLLYIFTLITHFVWQY